MPESVFSFFMAMEAVPTDTKTSVVNVKAFKLPDDETVYEMPEDQQRLTLHGKLADLPKVKQATASMKKRGAYRKVAVTLPAEVSKLYTDGDGNAIFEGNFLDVAVHEVFPTYKKVVTVNSDSTTEKLVEDNDRRSLQSITKDFVLEKFSGRNVNASVWIEQFESECKRMKVLTDQQADALRLFLEGSVAEWYSATRKTLKTVDWSQWKPIFIETYGTKGWSELTSAINFKYIAGNSLTEFAVKKLNLLVNADADLTEKSRVGQIVASLPSSVQTRISRATTDTFAKLMQELSQLEELYKGAYKGNTGSRRFNNRNREFSRYNQEKSTGSSSEKKGNCEYCRKNGKKSDNHTSEECTANPVNRKKYYYNSGDRNDNSNGSSVKSGGVRLSHNAELEDILNEQANTKN